MHVRYRTLFATTTALTALAFFAGPAFAQESSGAPTATATSAPAVQKDASEGGEIMVTARRRNEALVDVPLAISVVTSAKLQQLNITSTTELANFVPSLEFNNYTPGNARNDRGAQRSLVFRGLNVGGASVFLDGAAVSGNEVPAGLDIGQVEVLRGPQSVYFGRSTMTGAVSYRTKAIPDHWTAEGSALVAEQDERDLEASVAGPVVPGLLGVRVTGMDQHYGGYVRNDYDGSMLGKTSRTSISTTVDFTPASNLEFKGYANYFRDSDGASATAFIRSSFDNCTLPGATQATFCGEIPDRSHSVNYVNTTIPANMAAVIMGTPLIKGAGFDAKVGQQRYVINSDIVGTWGISDYLKLQSITAYHDNKTLAIADGIDQPVQASFPYSKYFYSYTITSRDFSQELRLTSDAERRLSWTFGGNFLWQQSQSQAIVDFLQQPSGTDLAIPQAIGTDTARTFGIFGGGYFKLTPKLTVSAEGRYQWDDISIRSQTPTQVETVHESATFKSFSPRVSLDYDLGGHRKIYASYSTGNTPGGFNTGLAQYRGQTAVLAQVQQLLGVTGETYQEQKLKIGEIGLKGNFAGGRGYFDINGYYGVLNNQQVSVQQLIPLLGYSVTATSNVGKSKIHGIEVQASYNLTKDLSVNGSFAWNDNERSQYVNTAGKSQFGTTDFSGRQFAYVPTYSGSAVVAYTHPIGGDWNFFSNVSGFYRGKEYVDAYNAAYIKGRIQADLRGGISNDRYTIELFVKNLFDNQQYTGGSIAPDYGTGTYYAFTGGWAEPRQIGGRVRFKL